MTEMAQGMSQSTDTPSSIPTSSPNVESQSAAQQPREERTFKQSEVTDIVKRERQEAIDRYQRLQREQPSYAAQKYGEQAQPQPPAVQSGAYNNDDHYRKIAAEEAQRLRDQWIRDAEEHHENEAARQTVQQFWNKVNVGKEKYQDFEKVTGDIQFASFPNVVRLLANYVENSGDVLYELGKDRTKMSSLEALALMSPKDAVVQAQRLAQSLKSNEDASRMKTPNEPLSQLRPSNTGMDSGAMSVSDLRKKYRM